MSDDGPRFIIELSIRDRRNEQQPVFMAIGCDDALRISSRVLDGIRLGRELGVGLVSRDDVITTIRTKVVRRDILKREAQRLAGLLADRMEDAEGWHGEDRAEAAREELGGRWR